MRRFPSPLSLTDKEHWKPGQYYSLDYVPMSKTSCRGYNGYLLMVDAATDKLFEYLLKTEGAEEFLNCFNNHFAVYHNGQYPTVVDCTHILSDNGAQATSKLFLDALKNRVPSIHINLSGPYQQVQNRVERFVQTVKGGVKTCMAYNNCPLWYW